MKILRFADFQETRLQASKLSNMGSALLLGRRCANIEEFCFQTAKHSVMGYAEIQGSLLLITRNDIFRRNVAAKRQIRAVPSSKGVDLLMLRNSVFSMRNVFRLCNVQIWALPCKDFDSLVLRNRVSKLRNVNIYIVLIC